MAKNQKGKTKVNRFVDGFDKVTGKVRRFLSDTIAELKRCTWPSRNELFESTILVIVVIAILSVFVAGVDQVAMAAIRFITTKN